LGVSPRGSVPPAGDGTAAWPPWEGQSCYFDAKGHIKVAHLRFWLSALPAP